MTAREEFVERYARAILDLPDDVKVPRDVLDDEAIPEERRILVAGALFSLLQPGDLVPDTWGPLGLVDDAIVLRLAIDAAVPADGEDRPRHAERHAEFFDELPGDLAAARAFLGDAFELFEKRLDRLGGLEHKGKNVPSTVRDETARGWLIAEVDEAMTDVEVGEDELLAAMRRVDHLLVHLRRRLSHR